MKKCPYCAEDIQADAIICKHCGKELDKAAVKKKAYKWTWYKKVIVGFVVLFVALMVKGCVSNSNTPSAPPDHKQMANIISQSYVKSALKSPATADFPTFDYGVTDLGGNRFEVSSYVDSENGFGAKLRSQWYTKLKYSGTGNDADPTQWTLEELRIDGKQLFPKK